MYIISLFHSRQLPVVLLQISEYLTWCQNRGCSYISSIRRIYRSNPAVSCIPPSILNVSTVELQFYQFFKRERKTVPGLQGSSTDRIFILCRQQGSPGSPSIIPCLQALYTAEPCSKHPLHSFPVSPSILHGRISILCSQRYPAVPCGVPVLQ